MDELVTRIKSINIENPSSLHVTGDAKKAFYRYPEHHEYIAAEVPFISWSNNTKTKGRINTYDTNIMGKFECTNANCNNKGWSSKKIAINIQLYTNHRYNAIVYNQRCLKCKQLGDMEIDLNAYTERVVYRLKKWHGLKVEKVSYSGQSNGPHQSALCEGCKAGHCSEGD